jgi:hypothetical protein
MGAEVVLCDIRAERTFSTRSPTAALRQERYSPFKHANGPRLSLHYPFETHPARLPVAIKHLWRFDQSDPGRQAAA